MTSAARRLCRHQIPQVKLATLDGARTWENSDTDFIATAELLVKAEAESRGGFQQVTVSQHDHKSAQRRWYQVTKTFLPPPPPLSLSLSLSLQKAETQNGDNKTLITMVFIFGVSKTKRQTLTFDRCLRCRVQNNLDLI